MITTVSLSGFLRAVHTWIYTILLFSKFFKLCKIGWWSLLDNHFNLAIDFQADLSQNCNLAHSGTFTVFLVSNSSVDVALCFRLLSCWKVNSSPSVWDFVLSSIPIIFYPENSRVLNDYKHTHNMMQPPLCLKICRVVLCNVLYWICPKHKTLYSGQ